MVSLEITLPENMLVFLETQVKARGFPTFSAYVQALIYQAQQAVEQGELESRFTQALRAIERGEPDFLSPSDWEAGQLVPE